MITIATEMLSTYLGYGKVAIGASRALQSAGVPHKIVTKRVHTDYAPLPDDITIRIADGLPDEAITEDDAVIQISRPTLYPPKRSKRNILWTFWEVAPLPPWSKPALEAFDAVIVSSEWNEELVMARAPLVDCYVVPLGVDTSVFNPDIPRQTAQELGTFIAGTSGRLAKGGIRKGIERVDEAFRNAQCPDGLDKSLYIKTLPDDPVGTLNTAELIAGGSVIALRMHISDPKMAQWYAALHLYISGSAGEGFGLQCLEAMACGTPVATIPRGGVMDFWDPSCGPALPFTTEPARGTVYKGWGAVWTPPTLDGITMAMESAMSDPERLAEWGRNAAKRASAFTIGRMNMAFLGCLTKVLGNL